MQGTMLGTGKLRARRNIQLSSYIFHKDEREKKKKIQEEVK